MARKNTKPNKFRPARPIVLNEDNTGFKTREQVEEAIEKLRDLAFLCTYGEKSRPWHLSFDDLDEVQEFKEAAAKCGVNLKSKLITAEEIEELDAEDAALTSIPGAEVKESYEDSKGRVHIVG
jgi:hypothetical protein